VAGAQTDTATTVDQGTPADHLGHGGRKGKGLALGIVAPLLNSTIDEVAAALRNGTSIAAQAEAAGVPLQTIVDALVADVSAKLASAVEAGRLTREQADERLAATPERLTTLLDGTRPLGGGHEAGEPRHGGRMGKGLALETVAPLLDSTPDEVRDALRAGTSIAAQAEAAGASLQTIVDALVADLSAKLGTAVEEGHLTQEQADAQLAAAPERITTMLEGTRPLRGGHQGGGMGRMGGGMRGGGRF
jgi:lambda repressor-like predicted transcriptional regulator